MRKFLTKKKLIIGGVVLVVILFVVFGGKSNGKEIVVVDRGEVVQEIVVTGKTRAEAEVSLGFDRTGRITKVYASVGDKVGAGTVIAELEAGEARADLLKAEAQLSEELVNLQKMKTTGPQQWADASTDLISAVRESFVKADDAVRNEADKFFKTPTTKPSFEVSFTDGNFVHYFPVSAATVIDLNSQRSNMEAILKAWERELASIDQSNALEFSTKALNNLNSVRTFFDKIASAINSFTPSEFAYKNTVDGYKTDVSNARSSISSAVSRVVAAKDKVSSAPELLDGGISSVLIQEAKVERARADVLAFSSILNKYLIRAPFAGIVATQDAKVGLVANAGEEMVTLIAENDMHIEANISELNVGKVKQGDIVKIDFDAFPGETFEGRVVYVEPGETIVDGVVNFVARVDLDLENKEKIKSGLTANLKIQTAKAENVVRVPAYAIEVEDDKSYVEKIEGKSVIKTEVTTGLHGSNGMVEIISGLEEGQNVEFGLDDQK